VPKATVRAAIGRIRDMQLVLAVFVREPEERPILLETAGEIGEIAMVETFNGEFWVMIPHASE
jgi:hypothetical protein